MVATLASVLVIADGSWATRAALFLGDNGFAVTIDGSGDAAFDERARTAGAAIVDLGLAARPAVEVLGAWRARTTAPILAVGSTSDESVVVAAYEAGADHVAPADITARQLLARVRSLLRRQGPPSPEPIDAAADQLVHLDAAARAVRIGEVEVVLAATEFEFVQLLVERAGRLVARAELAAMVGAKGGVDRNVDFFVRRVRQKLEQVDGQRRIHVVRGVGFRFLADAPAAVGPAGPA